MTTTPATDPSAALQPRTPRGKFAVTSRVEPELALRQEPQAAGGGVDKYGFPVVICPLCQGAGRNGRNNVDGDMCYGCGGTGHQYAAHVLRAVTSEFAAARRAATRPRVRDLKVGDTVSKPYNQLSQAEFKTVARILVASARPTRFEGRAGAKKAVAFAAAVDYSDGTRDVVTTDAVYARRGFEVDPAPFVARAIASEQSANRSRPAS